MYFHLTVVIYYISVSKKSLLMKIWVNSVLISYWEIWYVLEIKIICSLSSQSSYFIYLINIIGRAGTPKLISQNSCMYTCIIHSRTMPRPGSHKSERFGQNEGALHSGRCPTECHRPGFKFVGKFCWKNWVLHWFWAMFQGEASPRNVHITKFRGKLMWNFQKKKFRL